MLARMPTPPQLYTVRISFDALSPDHVARQLWASFSDYGPVVAMPTGVFAEEGRVVVEFGALSDDPTDGPTTAEQGAPGAELVAALHGFQRERTLIAPLLRALLATSTARQRAGLNPREGVGIEIQLAKAPANLPTASPT
jgi:hypothetical protein